MEGAFASQVPAHAVQLIDPGLTTCRSVKALMAYIHSNVDKPETKEKHKEWLIVYVVVGIQLHPYENSNEEDALEVGEYGGITSLTWNDLMRERY